MTLDAELEQPGLPVADRLLAISGAAIWSADWPRLCAAAKAASTRGLPRAELEEALLQAVLFCGFPRVVTAFEQLATAWPVATPPSGGAVPEGERCTAGRALFAAIYGKNDAAVRGMLASFHAEFHDFVLESAYGRILARPGLSPLRRELLAVALLAAQDQPRQFVAHARGAITFGADRAQLREVLATVFRGDAVRVDAWLARVR
ncbi:MAG: carboxymuconolactone decarboxylase family protein [Planctomycetota bacterium]